MSELKKTITEPVEEEVRALIPTANPRKWKHLFMLVLQ